MLIELRKYPTGTSGVWNRVVSGNANADVLFLGSSRALVNFDPDIVEQGTGRTGFNIGRDATRPDFQLSFLQMYLRHNRSPSYLVVALDIFSLEPTHFIYDPGQYIPYLDQPEIYAELRSLDAQWLLYKWGPILGMAADRGLVDFAGTQRERCSIEALRELFGCPRTEHTINGIRRNGYRPVHLQWRTDFAEFKKLHPDGLRYPTDRVGRETLRTLLALCKQMHIATVLVYPPEDVESQSYELNRSDILLVYQQLAEEFHVPFWDYSAHPLSRDRSLFYNSQHLNAEGSAKFSADIALKLRDLDLKK